VAFGRSSCVKDADSDLQQIAEYAMALDLSSQLTQVLDETRVLHQILEIFISLFAPERIIFHVMEGGAVITTLTRPENIQVPPQAAGGGFPVSDVTPAGFRLSIPFKGTTVGIIEVDGLAFPEYRERYLSLALALAGVCGLAIVNARTHNRLEVVLSDLKAEFARSAQLTEDLRNLNDHLEERIRRRTEDLELMTLHLEEEVIQRRKAEEMVRSQLEEKTLLLRELDHRVKNNFQIIMSILSLQARKVADPTLQLALNESRNRIRTMAAVHNRLLSHQDLSRIDTVGYARDIISRLLSLYQIEPGRVSTTLDIPDILIDINTAIPIGLILNELISNSLKYGLPEEIPGEISLVIHDEGTELTILCRDNGPGLPEDYDWKNPDTVGLVLVLSLVGQLQGTIEKEPGPGTGFFIRVQKVMNGSRPVRGTYNQVGI
jgi:two-component sensor histidine kinase